MLALGNQILDISELESLALNLCRDLKVGDLIMLRGDLGVGKTTFSRFIIKNLYSLNNKKKPKIINSPTYPILLTYSLGYFEIFHYDFYRIKNIKEIEEIDFFENIKNSITLIEWPDLLIETSLKQSHYLINIDIYSETKRVIDIKYIK